LIDDLKLEAISAFESQSLQLSTRRLVRFNTKGVWTHAAVAITAYQSTHALASQPALPQDVKTLSLARKLQQADPRTHCQEDIPVEILIGGDHYWRIVKDRTPIRVSEYAVLVPTAFGWILSGNRFGTHVNSAVVNFINSEQSFTPSEYDLRCLWDLEAMGNPRTTFNH
jgi:hypothetical protein